MKSFLTLILPFIVICLPIAGYLTYYILDKTRTRKKVLLTGLIILLVGILTPWVATFIASYGIAYDLPPDEPVCATGAGFFWFIGYIATLFGTPIIGLILYFSTEKNNKTLHNNGYNSLL